MATKKTKTATKSAAPKAANKRQSDSTGRNALRDALIGFLSDGKWHKDTDCKKVVIKAGGKTLINPLKNLADNPPAGKVVERSGNAWYATGQGQFRMIDASKKAAKSEASDSASAKAPAKKKPIAKKAAAAKAAKTATAKPKTKKAKTKPAPEPEPEEDEFPDLDEEDEEDDIDLDEEDEEEEEG